MTDRKRSKYITWFWAVVVSCFFSVPFWLIYGFGDWRTVVSSGSLLLGVIGLQLLDDWKNPRVTYNVQVAVHEEDIRE